MFELPENPMVKSRFESIVRTLITKPPEEWRHALVLLVESAYAPAQHEAERKRIEFEAKHPESAELVRAEKVTSILQLQERQEESP